MSLGYDLVADVLVSSNTSLVEFTGLNFTSDDLLMLVADIKNPSAVDLLGYTIFCNNNQGTSNYYVQVLYCNNTTLTRFRSNTTEIANAAFSQQANCIAYLKITQDNTFVSMSDSIRNIGSSALEQHYEYTTGTFTATSITSLQITPTVTDKIGAGSRFKLYKLNAEKLADVTVSSATTQVDITGLSLDKTNELLLVSDFKNALNANNSCGLYVNSDTTSTNYWGHFVFPNSTVLSSGRFNATELISAKQLSSSFGITNLKVSNDDHFNFYSRFIRNYGGSTVELTLENVSYVPTLTTISSLSIVSSTNGIANGSRFALYKLK